MKKSNLIKCPIPYFTFFSAWGQERRRTISRTEFTEIFHRLALSSFPLSLALLQPFTFNFWVPVFHSGWGQWSQSVFLRGLWKVLQFWREEFSKSPDIKFYPCHYSHASLNSFETRSKEAGFISLTGKSVTSFEQTPWGELSLDCFPSHPAVPTLGTAAWGPRIVARGRDGMNRNPKLKRGRIIPEESQCWARIVSPSAYPCSTNIRSVQKANIG